MYRQTGQSCTWFQCICMFWWFKQFRTFSKSCFSETGATMVIANGQNMFLLQYQVQLSSGQGSKKKVVRTRRQQCISALQTAAWSLGRSATLSAYCHRMPFIKQYVDCTNLINIIMVMHEKAIGLPAPTRQPQFVFHFWQIY